MINLCQPSIHSLRQLAVSLKQSLACIFPRSSPNVKTLALGGFMILKGHQKVKNATDFRNGKWLTNSKAKSNCITELNEAHTYRAQRSTYLQNSTKHILGDWQSGELGHISKQAESHLLSAQYMLLKVDKAKPPLSIGCVAYLNMQKRWETAKNSIQTAKGVVTK